MHVPSVSVRFGLILEAYCRGNVEHLAPLVKQKEAILYMGKLAEIIKVSTVTSIVCCDTIISGIVMIKIVANSEILCQRWLPQYAALSNRFLRDYSSFGQKNLWRLAPCRLRGCKN